MCLSFENIVFMSTLVGSCFENIYWYRKLIINHYAQPLESICKILATNIVALFGHIQLIILLRCEK